MGLCCKQMGLNKAKYIFRVSKTLLLCDATLYAISKFTINGTETSCEELGSFKIRALTCK